MQYISSSSMTLQIIIKLYLLSNYLLFKET